MISILVVFAELFIVCDWFVIAYQNQKLTTVLRFKQVNLSTLITFLIKLNRAELAYTCHFSSYWVETN